MMPPANGSRGRGGELALSTTAPELLQRVRVEPSGDKIVADRKRGALLRQQFLDPIEIDDRPILVDLNPLNVLSLGAADELVVKWLDRVRTPRNPVVAVFASYDDEIRGTLDAALKAGHQAAYLVRSAPEHERPLPIGELTTVQYETIETIRGRSAEKSEPISSKDVMADLRVEKPNTAYMRLFELYKRGLLSRLGSNGSTTFYYPLDLKLMRLLQVGEAVPA
jgi:hypothetical protein